jgi:hypothetical protein
MANIHKEVVNLRGKHNRARYNRMYKKPTEDESESTIEIVLDAEFE